MDNKTGSTPTRSFHHSPVRRWFNEFWRTHVATALPPEPGLHAEFLRSLTDRCLRQRDTTTVCHSGRPMISQDLLEAATARAAATGGRFGIKVEAPRRFRIGLESACVPLHSWLGTDTLRHVVSTWADPRHDASASKSLCALFNTPDCDESRIATLIGIVLDTPMSREQQLKLIASIFLRMLEGGWGLEAAIKVHGQVRAGRSPTEKRPNVELSLGLSAGLYSSPAKVLETYAHQHLLDLPDAEFDNFWLALFASKRALPRLQDRWLDIIMGFSEEQRATLVRRLLPKQVGGPAPGARAEPGAEPAPGASPAPGSPPGTRPGPGPGPDPSPAPDGNPAAGAPPGSYQIESFLLRAGLRLARTGNSALLESIGTCMPDCPRYAQELLDLAARHDEATLERLLTLLRPFTNYMLGIIDRAYAMIRDHPEAAALFTPAPGPAARDASGAALPECAERADQAVLRLVRTSLKLEYRRLDTPAARIAAYTSDHSQLQASDALKPMHAMLGQALLLAALPDGPIAPLTRIEALAAHRDAMEHPEEAGRASHINCDCGTSAEHAERAFTAPREVLTELGRKGGFLTPWRIPGICDKPELLAFDKAAPASKPGRPGPAEKSDPPRRLIGLALEQSTLLEPDDLPRLEALLRALCMTPSGLARKRFYPAVELLYTKLCAPALRPAWLTAEKLAERLQDFDRADKVPDRFAEWRGEMLRASAATFGAASSSSSSSSSSSAPVPEPAAVPTPGGTPYRPVTHAPTQATPDASLYAAADKGRPHAPGGPPAEGDEPAPR